MNEPASQPESVQPQPSEMIRGFIALNLPAEVSDAMQRLQTQLKTLCPKGLVRWTPAQQVHLTLRFLGDIARESVTEIEDALRRACEDVAPFEVLTGGLGCFPDLKRPCVVWLALEGDRIALTSLQARIAAATAAWGEIERREFRPHLTIGRVGKGSVVELRRLGEAIRVHPIPPPSRWRVIQVEFMRSELHPHGARHTRLAIVGLAGG